MIFDEILKLYSEAYDNHIQAEKDYKESIEKKWFSIVPSLTAKIEIYKKNKEDLKMVLSNNFRTEILEEISKAEAEHQYQQEVCTSIAQTYGSELAGDYNVSEILAYKNLIKMTRLLNV